MKRSREAFDAEADPKQVYIVIELSDAVCPGTAGTGSRSAASGEAPPVDAGVDDVAPEPDRMKTVSGDGGDGAKRRDDMAPSEAAVPSDLEAAYKEIDESFDEAAEPFWEDVPDQPTEVHPC
jgi:hypothetical protein